MVLQPWKAPALRSLPTASTLRMRLKRAAVRTTSSNGGGSTPSSHCRSPMQRGTVIPAASALPAAFPHAAATLRRHPMSQGSITTTTPRRTPPGSLPVFLPEDHPCFCHAHMPVALQAPLTIHHPPPLKLEPWLRKAGRHNLVALDQIPLPTVEAVEAVEAAVAAWGRESTASTAPPTIKRPAHPTSHRHPLHMAPPGSALRMITGLPTPTSTPTLPLWLQSML